MPPSPQDTHTSSHPAYAIPPALAASIPLRRDPPVSFPTLPLLQNKTVAVAAAEEEDEDGAVSHRKDPSLTVGLDHVSGLHPRSSHHTASGTPANREWTRSAANSGLAVKET